jgi:hypothetical protein
VLEIVSENDEYTAADIKWAFETEQSRSSAPAQLRRIRTFEEDAWRDILRDLGQSPRTKRKTFRQRDGDCARGVKWAKHMLTAFPTLPKLRHAFQHMLFEDEFFFECVRNNATGWGPAQRPASHHISFDFQWF